MRINLKPYLSFLLIGVIFGITLTKSEVISWYRIQEMFRFHSFHMYGVIGSAVITGIILLFLSKKNQWTDLYGNIILPADKQLSIPRYLIGGIIFGIGWALTGACPGPLYILVGNGITVYIIAILSAILGTWVYGSIRHKLPH